MQTNSLYNITETPLSYREETGVSEKDLMKIRNVRIQESRTVAQLCTIR